MNQDTLPEEFQRDVVPLLKKRYNPERIIIFGSYATNTSHEGSDVDVILVSDYFSSIPFISRMTEVLLNIPFRIHVDYICYTPDEFCRLSKTSAIVKEALEGPFIALA
jgi:predicted nucleotidyltransferase